MCNANSVSVELLCRLVNSDWISKPSTGLKIIKFFCGTNEQSAVKYRPIQVFLASDIRSYVAFSAEYGN